MADAIHCPGGPEGAGQHIEDNFRNTIGQALGRVAVPIRAGLAALVTVMAVVMPGHGQTIQGFYSGNELFETCKRNPAACLGYISGSFDALAGSGGTLNGWRTCPPQAALTNVQIRDVVMKYLTEHPEYRHLSAAALIARALSSAFPCPP
jgi:Ssp1 endopeptidase immunity protein Rap1a